MRIQLGSRWIGDNEPVYTIADIGANHDGSLERALMLIRLAAEAGADAVKFQHFRADHLVSKRGFKELGQIGHQKDWAKPVYEVYQEASIPWDWTPALAWQCKMSGVDFLSTPYDIEAVDHLDPYVPAFKIGSGDIDHLELLRHIASKGKPVILSTGAAEFDDVSLALCHLRDTYLREPAIVIMQCNTNYEATGRVDYLNLRALMAWGLTPDSKDEEDVEEWNMCVGLSDHNKSISIIAAAIALGARVIERHFTDSNNRIGPDHAFAMTQYEWEWMVNQIKETQAALGDGIKKVEPNEQETVITQRRCIRAAQDIPAGTVLTRDMLAVLRPAPPDALKPPELGRVIGQRVKRAMEQGECLKEGDLG